MAGGIRLCGIGPLGLGSNKVVPADRLLLSPSETADGIGGTPFGNAAVDFGAAFCFWYIDGRGGADIDRPGPGNGAIPSAVECTPTGAGIEGV
jgi:hypothetical protein